MSPAEEHISTPAESPDDLAGPSGERNGYALCRATVHSTGEPYADALTVEDGTISWIGAEETVRHLPGQPAERIDAQGALVAPAFAGWMRLGEPPHDAEGLGDRMDAALRQGTGLLRLSLDAGLDGDEPDEDLTSTLVAAARTALAHPLDVQPILAPHGPGLLGAEGFAAASSALRALLSALDEAIATSDSPAPANECAIELPLGELLDRCVDDDAGGVLREDAREQLEQVLLGWRRFALEAGRQLVLSMHRGTSGGSDRSGAGPERSRVAVEALAATQQALRSSGSGVGPGRSAAPGRATVLLGFDTAERELWTALRDCGVHVCLTGAGHLATALSVGVPAFLAAPEGESPWRLISDLVHRDADSVSVRAAFNAHTRGARRALPAAESGGPASMGQLNPGEPATFALWHADALAVQTPESRVAAWSTDARSRTPLLPYLDGSTLPECTATVIAGVWIHTPNAGDRAPGVVH